jgi:hypothetical protein
LAHRDGRSRVCVGGPGERADAQLEELEDLRKT